MLHEPLVILDFETTGLRPERGDRITEVGLVRIEGGRITDRYQSLVNCGLPLPSFVSTYTGITQAMIDAAPAVDQVIRNVAAFIGNTPVVAHCAVFDHGFYVHERLRQGISWNAATEPFICSMRLARRLYPDLQSHSLAALSASLGLHYRGVPQRAAADAEATALLMLKIGRDMARMNDDLPVTAQMLRRIIDKPLPRARVNLTSLCA